MTNEELIKKVSDLSGNLFTLANDNAFKVPGTFKDAKVSPVLTVLREFLRNTAYTLDTIVEELEKGEGAE